MKVLRLLAILSTLSGSHSGRDKGRTKRIIIKMYRHDYDYDSLMPPEPYPESVHRRFGRLSTLEPPVWTRRNGSYVSLSYWKTPFPVSGGWKSIHRNPNFEYNDQWYEFIYSTEESDPYYSYSYQRTSAVWQKFRNTRAPEGPHQKYRKAIAKARAAFDEAKRKRAHQAWLDRNKPRSISDEDYRAYKRNIFEGNLDMYTDKIAKGTHDLVNGTKNLAKGTHNFAKGTDNLAKGTHNFAKGTDNFAKGTHNLTKDTNNFAKGTDNLGDGMVDIWSDENTTLRDSRVYSMLDELNRSLGSETSEDYEANEEING